MIIRRSISKPRSWLPIPIFKGLHLNTLLLKTAFRVWLMEILISGFNYFVLMNLVYEPGWGELAAHQIGMSTSIACGQTVPDQGSSPYRHHVAGINTHIRMGRELNFKTAGRRDFNRLEYNQRLHVAIRPYSLFLR